MQRILCVVLALCGFVSAAISQVYGEEARYSWLLTGPSGDGYCVPHPNGRLLATVGFDHIRITDIRTNRLIRLLDTLGTGTLRMEFSPDGRLLAAYSPAHLAVFDVERGGAPIFNSAQYDFTVRFSPDSAFLYMLTQQGIRIYRTLSNGLALERTISLTNQQTSTLAISSSGTYAAFQRNGITIINLQTGAIRRYLPLTALLGGLTFCKDDQCIAGADISQLRVFNVDTGQNVLDLYEPLHGFGRIDTGSDKARLVILPSLYWSTGALRIIRTDDWVTETFHVTTLTSGIALAPGRSAYWASVRRSSGGSDTSSDSKLLDLYTSQPLQVVGGDQLSPVLDGDVSPDSKLIATPTPTGLVIRKVANGEAVYANDRRFTRIRFSRSGNYLVTLYGTSTSGFRFDVLRTDTWDVISSNTFQYRGNSIDISPNDMRVVVGWGQPGFKGGFVGCQIREYDLASGKLLRSLYQNNAPLHGLSYTPDGSKIVGASLFNTLVFDVASGSILVNQQLPNNAYFALAPSGTKFAVRIGTYPQVIQQYATASGSPIGGQMPEYGAIKRLTYVDESTLLSSYESNGVEHAGISSWNMSTATRIRHINLNLPGVNFALPAPNRNFIVISGWTTLGRFNTRL